MARYAIIQDGVAVNIAEADADFANSQGWIPAGAANIGDLWDGKKFASPPPLPVVERRATAWELVKIERDRRKSTGVKVGANWFHSDDTSRIQQLALVMLGANMPAGLQWKTLTHAGTVSVPMTPTLAGQIFQATVMGDAAIFAVAEAKRVAIEGSADPQQIEIGTGWPASFEDVGP